MSNPFIRKLEYGAKLNEEDRALLERVSSQPRHVPDNTDLVQEGDKPRNVHLVMDGYACRYKVLPDGRRQIMAIFVPGDLCDLHVHILGEMDHAIGTLTRAQVVELPPAVIDQLIANPRVNRGLWWSALVDEGTLREWLVSMGQRGAAEQMAHIFCELFVRMKAVGLTNGQSMPFPLTQDELADLMGITPIHVNRTLKLLRAAGLVKFSRSELCIPDFDKLKEIGGFESNYLHLRDRRADGSSLRESAP